jgi:hypothetical protein
MKKQLSKIRFDLDELSEITDELVEIDNNIYTKRTCHMSGSLRFPIPRPIVAELDLKAGDTCFYCQYSEGFYLSFKHEPDTATASQKKARKLASAGEYGTLYLGIPPMIKNLYNKEITNIQLCRPKGYRPHEWQLQFLFIECS